MNFRSPILTKAFFCGALPAILAACGGGGGGGSQASINPTTQAAEPTPTDVFVSGTQLIRNGTPWIPHGFYQIAFEVPPGELPYQKPFWTTASQNYTPAEYTQMRQSGVDSVRIQLAQPGMDPQNALFSAPFRDKAIGAIQAARAAGLTVIVSIQDEPQTGDPQQSTALPGAATQRVWQELAPVFGQDRGVMFELFNEPHIGPQAVVPFPTPDWSAWAAAMNQTIQTIRSLGAKNVVVADGLQYAQELSGAPQLNDPLHQVAYAAHPYSLNAADQTPAVWDVKFGSFAATAPVIVSEWGIGYYCDANTPTSVVTFLQYLQSHRIGLEAGSWDWASAGFGSVIYGFPNSKVSTFVGPSGPLTCHQDNTNPGYYPGFGPGKMMESWFQTGTPPAAIQ
jgi:endoglucanase